MLWLCGLDFVAGLLLTIPSLWFVPLVTPLRYHLFDGQIIYDIQKKIMSDRYLFCRSVSSLGVRLYEKNTSELVFFLYNTPRGGKDLHHAHYLTLR